jgi:hypothetical protein
MYKTTGIKYLYFRKTSKTIEIFFDARFIFQGLEFYLLQRLPRFGFPTSFAATMLSKRLNFKIYFKTIMS